MATWTDSRFKDFLRHPIGYLNGDRAAALEGNEARDILKEPDAKQLPVSDAGDHRSEVKPEAPKVVKPFRPPSQAWADSLKNAVDERIFDITADDKAASLRELLKEGSERWNIKPNVEYALRDVLEINIGQSRVIPVLDALFEYGATPNSAYTDGWTPLLSASCSGDPEMVNYLIGKGADVNKGQWEGTREELRDHIRDVKRERGSDFFEDSLGGRPEYNRTALHEAVWFGNQPVITALLKAGADPHALDEAGSTSYDIAGDMGLTGLLQRYARPPAAIEPAAVQLFEGANLSPEAADIYKASLSRNMQDTNDALDRIGGQAEPEQQAYNKQADPLDMKLDRAGEAAYQQTLKANGQVIKDSITTKAQADPAKIAAAWSSTQPTKENLEAVKPAHVAPALAPSRRPKI